MFGWLFTRWTRSAKLGKSRIKQLQRGLHTNRMGQRNEKGFSEDGRGLCLFSKWVDVLQDGHDRHECLVFGGNPQIEHGDGKYLLKGLASQASGRGVKIVVQDAAKASNHTVWAQNNENTVD